MIAVTPVVVLLGLAFLVKTGIRFTLLQVALMVLVSVRPFRKPKRDQVKTIALEDICISLPSFVVSAIREALDLGLDGGPNDLVFPSTKRTPRFPWTGSAQLRASQENIGVDVAPHDLRRTVDPGAAGHDARERDSPPRACRREHHRTPLRATNPPRPGRASRHRPAGRTSRRTRQPKAKAVSFR
jgi:hypothetical protein